MGCASTPQSLHLAAEFIAFKGQMTEHPSCPGGARSLQQSGFKHARFRSVTQARQTPDTLRVDIDCGHFTGVRSTSPVYHPTARAAQAGPRGSNGLLACLSTGQAVSFLQGTDSHD